MSGSMKNILISLVVFYGVLNAQKAVKMSSSATDIFKNDVFELEIRLENFNSDVSVQYPSFNDLQKISGPFQSSSTSIINGTMTKSVTLTYQFAPKRTGKITIDPVSVTDEGKVYKSDPLTVNVFEQGSAANNSRDMFIVAEISSKNVFVGEMVRLDLVLYIKPEIRLSAPSVKTEPKFTGFVKENIEIPQEKLRTLVQTIYKGTKYNTLPLRSYWLTPTSSGEKVIESVSVNVPVEVRTKKKNRGFFNDPFFDDDVFSGFSSYQDKTVLSDELNLTVTSLPEQGKPSDFSGAVGTFSIMSSLDRDSVSVNEGVSLKIVISGTGNLSDIRDLNLKFPRDFEVYDPKRTVSLNQDNKKNGKITFEYLLLARNPGKHALKDISFPYFDLKEKKYRSVRTKDHLVTVSGEGKAFAASRAGGFSRRDVEVLASDIRYIKKDRPDFYKIESKYFNPAEFFARSGVSIFIIILSLFVRVYISKNSGNEALSRRKKAAANAIRRLKESYKVLGYKDYLKFYKTLDEALLKFIADKLNISHAGIVTDEIVPVLKNLSVPDDIISDFTGLLNKSASIQYAASKPGEDEMAKDIEKAKELMSELIVRLK